MASHNVSFISEAERKGLDFCAWLKQVVLESEVDMVVVDPLLSYAGGDIAKQEVASDFFRTGIQPILNATGVIVVFVHHTGKTSTDAKARAHWVESDFAYADMGSSELANWPRAKAMIIPVAGHEKKFRFMLTKRGSRAGMRSSFTGECATSIYIQHSPVGMGWIEIEEPVETSKPRNSGGPPPKITAANVISAIGGASTMIRRDKLTADLSEKHKTSDRTVRGLIQLLLESEQIHTARTEPRPRGGRDIEWLRFGPPPIGNNLSETSETSIPDCPSERGQPVGDNPPV